MLDALPDAQPTVSKHRRQWRMLRKEIEEICTLCGCLVIVRRF